jgi:hypothetical protein
VKLIVFHVDVLWSYLNKLRYTFVIGLCISQSNLIQQVLITSYDIYLYGSVTYIRSVIISVVALKNSPDVTLKHNNNNNNNNNNNTVIQFNSLLYFYVLHQQLKGQ